MKVLRAVRREEIKPMQVSAVRPRARYGTLVNLAWRSNGLYVRPVEWRRLPTIIRVLDGSLYTNLNTRPRSVGG